MLEPTLLVCYFALAFLSWFTYKTYIYPNFISPLRKIPGPSSGSLLFGNLKSFFVEESGETHTRWIKKYGNFVKYHGLLNQPNIIVTDANLIQDIVLKNEKEFIKPMTLRGDFMKILGKGLTVVEGVTHKRQRKMMIPAFTYNNIKNMVPSFIRVSLTLKSLMDDKVNKEGSTINLSPYITKATLDAIGIVAFNHEFNSLTIPSELAEAYKSIMEIVLTFLNAFISNLSIYAPFLRKIPLEINKKYNIAGKVIERESIKLIEEKYHDDRNNKLVGNDLLSILIKINKTLPVEEKLTDEELKFQIMTFLFAGHEATNNSTTWALHLLAKNPDMQDKLREELVEAFPDKSKFNPTYDEIDSLKYLNCVIKETLRLYPAASFIQRSNIKDMVFGEHFIPKGTIIDIPIATLQRLPSIWGPTADDFDPKRWLNPSLIKDITNYDYLPFGAGIRSCIGNKLALIKLKVLLGMLVRNFTYRPVEGFQIKKSVYRSSKVKPYLQLIVSKVEA